MRGDGQERPADEDLLLVAAREAGHERLDGRRAHAERGDAFLGQRGLRPAVHDAETRQPPECQERDVLAHRQRQQEALAVAVAGQVHDARIEGARRVPQAQRSAFQVDAPERSGVMPARARRKRSLAVALDARQAHDLPGMDPQVHVAEPIPGEAGHVKEDRSAASDGRAWAGRRGRSRDRR